MGLSLAYAQQPIQPVPYSTMETRPAAVLSVIVPCHSNFVSDLWTTRLAATAGVWCKRLALNLIIAGLQLATVRPPRRALSVVKCVHSRAPCNCKLTHAPQPDLT